MLTTTSVQEETTTATIEFLDELFGRELKQVSFQLWDGTRWPDDRPRAARLVLKHPAALRAMFAPGTEKGLAEAFLRDDFDIEGEIEAAFELADALQEIQKSDGWLKRTKVYWHLRHLPGKPAEGRNSADFVEGRRHSLQRDRKAISFHYDVSNDFFQLWLDPRMVYSCAYFQEPDYSLEDAQTAKLRHLCRKLRLRPGQKVLDIGCGWGGFALYAAAHHGVDVTGVTLSRQQAELARRRADEQNLGSRVHLELRDYRELAARETYDAIVSVGMSEHVGAGQQAAYFQRVYGLLKPGGIFLNHAIGEGVRRREQAGPSFIQEYVFPDSDIPPIPRVVEAAESAGFEVRDVENLREHYCLTLRHWVERLEARHAAARAFVSEATYRVWRLYMAGSARGFDRGHLAIYQTLLSKADGEGRAHLPLTRDDWYRSGR